MGKCYYFKMFFGHKIEYVIGYYDSREEAVLKIKSKLKSVFGEAENRSHEL
jgi:hypothetical protein